jgi:hypothetical protein
MISLHAWPGLKTHQDTIKGTQLFLNNTQASRNFNTPSNQPTCFSPNTGNTEMSTFFLPSRQKLEVQQQLLSCSRSRPSGNKSC